MLFMKRWNHWLRRSLARNPELNHHRGARAIVPNLVIGVCTAVLINTGPKTVLSRKLSSRRTEAKFPEGYKSAFDKWKEKQPKKTASAILDQEGSNSEYSETDLRDLLPVWCLPQCAVTAKGFEHANPFSAIAEDDEDDDDEDKMAEALNHISSNVNVGPKL